MKKVKFIFDLDGTITAIETLPLIAANFNLQKEISQLTADTIAGNIPFMESFIYRVNLISKIPINLISNLLSDVPLHKILVEFIQKNKESCVIATGNLSCWVDKLTLKIGCECRTSEAETHNNQVVKIKSILRKEKVVQEYKIQGYKTVFIGDGNNDAEAMRLADISVAAGICHEPSNTVHSVADYVVYDEGALCRLLNQLL